MLSEKRFLPAHLNPTAALPALHTGTAGGCEISFAGNARVGKRSGSVKRRNALLCVRNTSGTAGGGRARAYSPRRPPPHRRGQGNAIRGRFALRAVSASVYAAFRLALEGKLFFRSALRRQRRPVRRFLPADNLPPLGMALSTPRHYRRRTEAPPSERENRRDAKIAAGLRVGLDSAAVRGHNGLGHRKPDAVTARVGTARRVDAVEAVKHPRQAPTASAPSPWDWLRSGTAIFPARRSGARSSRPWAYI